MPSRLTVVLLSLLLATPAVIFWLWLVIVPARLAILCPERCTCDTLGYYVECSDSSLTNIPLIFPTYVGSLLLDVNNITSLQKDSFISRGLTELERLGVWRCGLETIELGTFNGLAKLTHLSMMFNEISEIIPRTFENMSSLKFLDFAYNRLQYLEVDVFVGLVEVLYINLKGNELRFVHPDLFVGLPNLKILCLAVNPELEIPTDSQFINSHSLLRLDISGCNVRSVSVETFAKVSALERLELQQNNLSSVDINILKVLPKLSQLYLYDNPLQCDCQLQEVWRWCQDHNIQTACESIVPECDTPSEVQGIWWGVLEKGECLHGNISYYGDYENTSYRYNPIEDMVSLENTNYTHNPAEDKIRVLTFSINRLIFLNDVQALVFLVLFIFGTTGNAILLIIIICNKDMRTLSNMYILNLVISDMIYLIVHFADYCAYAKDSTFLLRGNTSIFFPFCRRLSVGLSAYSVAVYSIQRYRVTVNPFHVRVSSQQTCRATVARICGVWIVAALFALPSALSGYLYNKYFILRFDTYNNAVVVFELLVSCVLPLCVIAFSYIMTARHLMKSAQPISEETQNPQLNTRKNTAKIVLGLTFVFMITYVPSHVMGTYNFFDIFSLSNEQFENIFGETFLVSTCLLLLNSCLNPIALFCTSLAFRRQFKRYLTCCWKANPTANNIELTRRN
jgi:Leucine-rich repeat (LRR) protein